jgi:hypothetical protein
MNSRRAHPRFLPLLLLGVVAALLLSACAAAAAPSARPSDAVAPTPGASQGGGGGSDGDAGSSVPPVDPGPADPAPGEPTLVVARPGQLDPHPVAVSLLEASVDGRRVLVKASWSSGVEPCYVLDSVKLDQGGNEFVLTVVEGTGDPNAMCIEIAMYKATIVDLGELEPGEYTIRASEGEAPPITVTVG